MIPAFLDTHRAPLALLVALLAASIDAGPAHAATSSNFTYSSPQTGFYAISPQSFAPSDDETASNFFNGSYLGSHLFGKPCFNTTVSLPQGATLTSVEVHYYSMAGSDLSVAFTRQTFATGAVNAVISRTIKDDSGKNKSITLPVPAASRTVNNSLFDYGFSVCVGGAGTTFSGALIRYTYTSAGN